MEITWRLSVGWERERTGEKVQGIRSINGRYKIDGMVKNSTGNEEAKNLYLLPIDMN